jgi:hypothetical protein
MKSRLEVTLLKGDLDAIIFITWLQPNGGGTHFEVDAKPPPVSLGL